MMEDCSSGPPKKRQREAWSREALTNEDGGAGGGGGSGVGQFPAHDEPRQDAERDMHMAGASEQEDGGDGNICSGSKPEQTSKQAGGRSSPAPQLVSFRRNSLGGGSVNRASAPTGLGLGSGIGLPPRAAAGVTSGSLRRGSIGLPAIGIGGFNVTSGPPNSPGAWVHHDSRAANSATPAASAPATNIQGEGTAPATAAAAGGSKPSGDKPPCFQSTFQLAQLGLGQSGLAAALARPQDNGGSPEGLGPSPIAAGGSAGGGSTGGGANGSVCAGSGAGTSTPRSVTPSAGSLCRLSGHDLQALLKSEVAAAGIGGDQLQAALELAACVPLRAFELPDGGKSGAGGNGAYSNGSSHGSGLPDSLLAALTEVAAGIAAAQDAVDPKEDLFDAAAGDALSNQKHAARRAWLLRQLQAATLAAAHHALAQWEAMRAHTRAARRGWAAVGGLDTLATHRRKLLKHMLRLPAEEAGEELLEALEAVRANVAAALRAAAGRDAAAAAARAAAGRLLSAGVGGVTGARLAPGGATEAAADRDLNRLYTLLRLLLALEMHAGGAGEASPSSAATATAPAGLLAAVQLPATRSARVASRHLTQALDALPPPLQAAVRAGGAAVPLPAPLRSPGAGGGGDGTSPCASSGGDQRALPEVRRPSLGDRAGSSERRLLPMAGPPGHMLQAVSSADAVNGREQHEAVAAAEAPTVVMARRLQPGAWLASGDAGAAHGFKQQMAWEHAAGAAHSGAQQQFGLGEALLLPPFPGGGGGGQFPASAGLPFHSSAALGASLQQQLQQQLSLPPFPCTSQGIPPFSGASQPWASMLPYGSR